MSTDHDWSTCSAGQDFLSVRMTRALSAVLQERNRQIGPKGHAIPHEDQHIQDEIAQAASDFLTPVQILTAKNSWALHKAQHPRREQLVIGAALALAEIERLDRRSAMEPDKPTPPGPDTESVSAQMTLDEAKGMALAEMASLLAAREEARYQHAIGDEYTTAMIAKFIRGLLNNTLPDDLNQLQTWLQREDPHV